MKKRLVRFIGKKVKKIKLKITFLYFKSIIFLNKIKLISNFKNQIKDINK